MSIFQIISLFSLIMGALLMIASVAKGEYSDEGRLFRVGLLAWFVGILAVVILVYVP